MSTFTGNPAMPFKNEDDTSASDAAREDRIAAADKRRAEAKALALQNERDDQERLKKKQELAAINALSKNNPKDKTNLNLLANEDDSPTSLLG